MVGVSGATLLVTGGMAAGGAWWGVAGLLHLFAGAGGVLLAAEAFALHVYLGHWCAALIAILARCSRRRVCFYVIFSVPDELTHCLLS